jgi:hypothetical protein
VCTEVVFHAVKVGRRLLDAMISNGSVGRLLSILVEFPLSEMELFQKDF